MASTTKIMTALLALEEAQRLGDPVVEITEEMVAVEGSSMGLLPVTDHLVQFGGGDAAGLWK